MRTQSRLGETTGDYCNGTKVHTCTCVSVYVYIYSWILSLVMLADCCICRQSTSPPSSAWLFRVLSFVCLNVCVNVHVCMFNLPCTVTMAQELVYGSAARAFRHLLPHGCCWWKPDCQRCHACPWPLHPLLPRSASGCL